LVSAAAAAAAAVEAMEAMEAMEAEVDAASLSQWAGSVMAAAGEEVLAATAEVALEAH
jgi:hypothetical protein